MPAKKYVVTLTPEERLNLERTARSNKRSGLERQRARVLLRAAHGENDTAIAQATGVCVNTVAGVRRRFCQGARAKSVQRAKQTRRKARKARWPSRGAPGCPGLCGAARRAQDLDDEPPGGPLDGSARGGPCHGRNRAPDAQKNALKPWLKKMWCIPPKANAEFVAALEDTLEVYQRPFDPTRPQVCLDEASKQLLADVREPLPIQPGQVERVDGEYTRHGTAALFMVCEPLAGRRHVFVRAQRQRPDFAAVVKTLCDELYPQAEKIVLVLDQLNTHGVASLYQAYPPQEARRLAERLEIHHPPKHGSWLNMAEIELSVLARQCLAERMDNQVHLAREVAAWERTRNAAATRVDWRFTTADARIRLKHLYPQTLPC